MFTPSLQAIKAELAHSSEAPHAGMAGMKGVSCFLVTRYIVFALFTICNAITCSVAVWNSSLVHSAQLFQVDVYLISLGAFSLFSIFFLIFVELLCVNTITTRVWFECTWTALFWVMELAGAALIAVETDVSCSNQATRLPDVTCTSERVLLAFTWVCTITLLVYLLALAFIVTSQHHEDPEIWGFDVRTLRVTALRRWTWSTLATRFKKRASMDIYTPKPVRAQPDQPFRHPRGLGVEHEIEPFYPVFARPEQMDVPHSSNLPEAIPLSPLTAAPIVSSLMKPVPARDAENVRSLSLSQFDLPREPASSIVYSNPPGPVARQSNPSPSPPPLGEWPRQDIMQLPVKPKPKPKPKSPLPCADMVTQPRPRRPSGPRLRVPSVEYRHRSAPLDLSGVSKYETGRQD